MIGDLTHVVKAPEAFRFAFAVGRFVVSAAGTWAGDGEKNWEGKRYLHTTATRKRLFLMLRWCCL